MSLLSSSHSSADLTRATRRVEGAEAEASIRCAHSGVLCLGSLHTLFETALVTFNLLPMSPNDCYPCPRSIDRSEAATFAGMRRPDLLVINL